MLQKIEPTKEENQPAGIKSTESTNKLVSHISNQAAQFAVQIDRAMAHRLNLIGAVAIMEHIEKNRVFEARLDLNITTLGLSAADKKIIIQNLKSPHAVIPTGLPAGSKLYFNTEEILKGLSPEGQGIAINNIFNYQVPPSIEQRMKGIYQVSLKIYRQGSDPLLKAITPKEIAFHNFPANFDSTILLKEKTHLEYLKTTFFEQLKISPKTTALLHHSGTILVAISAAGTAWNIATSEGGNKVEAAAHEGTLLFSNIGGGWYAGILGGAGAAAICGPAAPMCALAIVTSATVLGGFAGQELGELYWKATKNLGEFLRANHHGSAFTGFRLFEDISQGLLPNANSAPYSNSRNTPTVDNGKLAEQHYHQGLLLVQKKDNQNALKKFTEAIGLNPNYHPALTQRGCCYLALKNYKQSVIDLELARQFDPQNCGIYYHLALAYLKSDQHKKALQEINEALKLLPTNGTYLAIKEQIQKSIAQTHFQNACNLFNKQKYQDALIEANAAIQLNPIYCEAHCIRASCYRETGKLQEAIAAYKQAISINPKYEWSYYNQARGTELIG